jgi:hypothetical protein
MAKQKPYIEEGQTIQWPIISRKSKDRQYNSQSETVHRRRTDNAMANQKP